MKTITVLSVVSIFVLGTNFADASIDKNLKYGQRDVEVTELQEFLIDGGFLNGTPTTFFGLLTLKAVKMYQKSVGVSPTGYVGVLTRQKINSSIEYNLATSNQAEIQETGTTTVIQNISKEITKTTAVSVDYCKNIEGIQTRVPDGMFLDNNGVCFVPTINQQTNIQTTNNQTQLFSQNSIQNKAVSSTTTEAVLPQQIPLIFSIKRTAGLVSKTVLPNTTNIKIGSFEVSGDSVDFGIKNVAVLISVSGYSVTNISNLTLRFGSGMGMLGQPKENPSEGVNYFDGTLSIPKYSTISLHIYADIGDAPAGSITSNISFNDNITNSVTTSNDGIVVYSATTTQQ